MNYKGNCNSCIDGYSVDFNYKCVHNPWCDGFNTGSKFNAWNDSYTLLDDLSCAYNPNCDSLKTSEHSKLIVSNTDKLQIYHTEGIHIMIQHDSDNEFNLTLNDCEMNSQIVVNSEMKLCINNEIEKKSSSVLINTTYPLTIHNKNEFIYTIQNGIETINVYTDKPILRYGENVGLGLKRHTMKTGE